MNENLQSFIGPSYSIIDDLAFFIMLFAVSFVLVLVLYITHILSFAISVLWLLLYGAFEIATFILVIHTYRGCIDGNFERRMGINCRKKAYMIEIAFSKDFITYTKYGKNWKEVNRVETAKIKSFSVKRGKIYYLKDSKWEFLGVVPHLKGDRNREFRKMLNSFVK